MLTQLVISIRINDSRGNTYGKILIILRVFLPNERAWAFSWTSSIVMSTLFLSFILSKVKAIITDGCSREFNHIDISQEICKNVLRIRCCFYLVRMGWTYNVIIFFPDSIENLNDRAYNQLKNGYTLG